MPAELVADLQRPLEVDVGSRPPLPERRDRERLGADVVGDRRPAPCGSTATTVRHAPELAIEAPMSIDPAG